MQRRNLAEDNIKLAFYMAKRYKCPFVDQEDIQGAALLGLVKASARYEPVKGIKFSVFACIVIRNEILQLLKREQKHRNVKSLEEEISDGMTLGEVLPDPRNIENSIVARIQLKTFWEDLGDREKKVVWMTVVQGIPQEAVGVTLHLSQSMVSRILKDVKKRGGSIR